MFIYKLPIQINENVLDIYLPSKDYIYNGMSKIDTPSLLNYASKHQHNIIYLTYSYKKKYLMQLQ